MCQNKECCKYCERCLCKERKEDTDVDRIMRNVNDIVNGNDN